MTLQSLIISKNKMKKNYWTSIVIYFPMKYVDVLYTIREQQAMCWILVSIRILTSTISITYNYSLRTICCTVWNLMTIHIVLIIQIWEWTLEGQTGILCMVIHSSIFKWKISTHYHIIEFIPLGTTSMQIWNFF